MHTVMHVAAIRGGFKTAVRELEERVEVEVDCGRVGGGGGGGGEESNLQHVCEQTDDNLQGT